MEYEFKHGEVYFCDYHNGYIMRFNKYIRNNIAVISSISFPKCDRAINSNNWSDTNLTGPKTRAATQEEINMLEIEEEKAGLFFKPHYNIY